MNLVITVPLGIIVNIVARHSMLPPLAKLPTYRPKMQNQTNLIVLLSILAVFRCIAEGMARLRH
jgi:hypothetical protein